MPSGGEACVERSQPANPFDLENVGQRILMSGNSLYGKASAIAAEGLDPTVCLLVYFLKT